MYSTWYQVTVNINQVQSRLSVCSETRYSLCHLLWYTQTLTNVKYVTKINRIILLPTVRLYNGIFPSNRLNGIPN